MPESSEAKSYVDIKLPLKEKPQLEKVKEEVPEVPQKVQRKIAKKVAACIAAGMVTTTGAFIALGETGNLPEQVQEWYNESSQPIRKMFGIEEAENTPVVVIPKETQEIPLVVEEEVVEEVNAPEIEGLKFDQETRKYLNEVGVEVGVWVEDAIEINGKMEDAIGLAPEVIRNILNENKEKGIFRFSLPFNLQKDKGIKMVELVSIDGGYKYIGIKYTEPIGLYASSDCPLGYKFTFIPKEDDPHPYSSQDYGGSYFFTGFEVKNSDGEIVPVGYEVEVVDWEPSVLLSQPYLSGSWEIQHFLEDVKIGQFIGNLLPSSPDHSYLDFRNRPDYFKNPGLYQASLWMNIFNDRSADEKSDLDKILSLGEKNNKTTVFVWPGNQETVHE